MSLCHCFNRYTAAVVFSAQMVGSCPHRPHLCCSRSEAGSGDDAGRRRGGATSAARPGLPRSRRFPRFHSHFETYDSPYSLVFTRDVLSNIVPPLVIAIQSERRGRINRLEVLEKRGTMKRRNVLENDSRVPNAATLGAVSRPPRGDAPTD